MAPVPPADPLQRPVRAELAPGARLADPAPGRPRVDAGPALLVALGRGAVLPRLAPAHHRGALAGGPPRPSSRARGRRRARGSHRRLVRARRRPHRPGPQPRLLLDPLARVGVRGRRPAGAPACDRGERLRRTRALAAWVGLAAIAVAARTFTDHELFPGAIALVPVLGTAAVIWAGMPRAALSLSPVAGLRPVQWFGGISYSLYLWHWPIIMFTPYITGRPSQAPVMVLLLVLSIVVADASKRWIEDPFRRAVPRERRADAAHPAHRGRRGCRRGRRRAPHVGGGRLHRREARRAAVPAVRRRRLTAARRACRRWSSAARRPRRSCGPRCIRVRWPSS